EEEYSVARECLSAADRPMKDIVVMFKGVDPRQLSDPGDQLQQVLGFKRALEDQKAILFATFDSGEEFERDLRSHLFRWIREHGNEAGSLRRPHPPAPQVLETSRGFLSQTCPKMERTPPRC